MNPRPPDHEGVLTIRPRRSLNVGINLQVQAGFQPSRPASTLFQVSMNRYSYTNLIGDNFHEYLVTI
jgi:hypothetical protein